VCFIYFDVCCSEQQRHIQQSTMQQLQYLSQAFSITHKGEMVDDYIQEIGIVPLRLSLYLQEQVDAFIADCKDTEGGILHIDAMSSVVVKNLSRSSAPIFPYSHRVTWSVSVSVRQVLDLLHIVNMSVPFCMLYMM